MYSRCARLTMRPITIVIVAELATALVGCGTTEPPPPRLGISLAVGEVRAITASNAPVLLDGDAGAEFTLIALNATEASSMAIEFLGGELSEPIGPPTPRVSAPTTAPSPARIADAPGSAIADFQTRLNQVDRHSLPSRIAAARVAFPGGHRLSATLSGVPAVGAQVALNVSTTSACATLDTHTGRVVAVTQYAVIVADEANPAAGFTDAEYAEIAEAFDAVVYPTLTESFGVPSDIDANGGRVVVFFTRAVNELTPPGPGGIVNGFFFSRDLSAKSGSGSCQGSNEAELLYVMAADPSGEVNGNVRTKDVVRTHSLGNLAHLTHYLINTSRRMLVNHAPGPEEDWLNAGLSQIAQELVYYRAANMSPRQNITQQTFVGSSASEMVVTAQRDNLEKLSFYLQQPGSYSPYGDEVYLETRGAAWQLLRYIADRGTVPERTLWLNLVNATSSGIANIEAAAGIAFFNVLRDWAVAQYTDDTGLAVATAFRHPSWNFRSVLPPLRNSAFPLTTYVLSNSSPVSVTLNPGGVAYLRFGVAARGTGSLRVAQEGASPSADLSLTIVRTK